MRKRKTPPRSNRDKELSRRNMVIALVVGITVILTFLIELPQKIITTINLFKSTETSTLTSTPQPSVTFTPTYINTDLHIPNGLLSTETATLTLFPKESVTPTTSLTFTPTPIPITRMPFETFFRKCRDNTFSSGDGYINVIPSCSDAGGEQVIQISWSVPNGSSYVGCTISMDAVQSTARSNEALVFWALGAYDNEVIKIKLEDALLEQEKLIALSTEWQQVTLPFLSDFPDIDLRQLQKLTIGIEYDPSAISRNGKGSACLSVVGFGSP